jgi:Flp pilus assembly protein TadB
MANSTEDIFKKYSGELEKRNTLAYPNSPGSRNVSEEFKQFKQDMMPSFSRYERWCENIGGIISLKLAKQDNDKIQAQINQAHLDITPSQAVGLSVLSFALVLIFGVLVTVAIALLGGAFSFLLLFLFIISSLFSAYYFYTMPERLANQWRLKAGNQMVPCILYVVVYMKHTSNLERAIKFASQHLEPPLSLDFAKVFWDVETGKFSSIKESLDYYLETWRTTNTEFIESFNLIESSLYEPSEARRIQILERSLQVILDGVYDKMLKYTHSVKAPLTNLYMLGIVLPTLGLALIPLASALIGGAIKWYHIVVLFNLLIPFMVFYMTNEVMLRRPGGYGESSVLELNPLYPKYKSKKPYVISAFICIPLFLIGLVPFLFNYTPLPGLFGLNSDYSFQDIGLSSFGSMKIFDFVTGAGPMGLLSLILSLFLPLSIFLFFSISYKLKTQEIIKSRDYSKLLESEFNNSLFQLGNRIGDGTPAELAFGRVAESAKGQVTENFFRKVNLNIQSLGMGLERAIFDNKQGAIIDYPSNLIATSMHILIESAKKGLQIAAQSLMSIADYVRNINKINERLKDLLADIISDMKSNMTFLAPLLAGIVVGLAAMITLILSKLSMVISQASASGTDLSSYANVVNIVELFKVENMISPFYLQVCVGIYIIEIIFILTKTLVTVESGPDRLKEIYEIARNIKSGGFLYLIVAFLAIVGLSFVASVALSSLVI